jgi:hypothetical protein
MSMLTIGASDSVCGAGRLCNDCPLEIQSLDPVSAGRHGRHPNLLRRVAWPGSRRIFPFSDETVAVDASHAESFTAMVADLMLGDLPPSHHALARQRDGISLR